MVQHIVLWSFKEGVEQDETFRRIDKIFNEFSPQVPGLKTLTLHRGFAGYDVCLISIHDDKAALEAYQHFPAHLEVKKIIADVRSQRASCDFEL